MQSDVVFGNAGDEGETRRGWFMGSFLEAGDPRSSDELEIKWGSHEAGEGRAEWAVNRRATTISILIGGRFRLFFPDREIVLERPGDYALWRPGVPHTWRAEEPCTILTVRWPSIPGDSIADAGTDR
jgi:uncharacterized cupin superfamily protein